jgi:hypothetical protein
MAGIVAAFPPIIVNLQQQNLLERAFHDGLYPNLAYRAEAMPEMWDAQTGQTILMSRPGLLKPSVQPLVPGTEPTGQTVPYEQWIATLNQYADSIDTHMPSSTVSNANLFLRNIHQLGLQAGQSLNQIARNAMFQAYLSGQTVATGTIGSGDTSIHVAALSGFTDVVIPNTNVAPQSVSPAYPLPVTVGPTGTTTSVTVIGALPDNPSDPNGPGTLILSAAIGTAYSTARVPVTSGYAPIILRAGGAQSIDGISTANLLTLQMVIAAVGYLRRANVQPHDDGFYHAHVSPLGNVQFFADPVFQRLNQSLPEHVVYKEGFIGQIANVLFFMNNESPETTNVGTLQATAGSSNALYAPALNSEIVNNSGVPIGMVLLTGKGVVYEKYLDESNFSTEAGTTGKIGEFDVTNDGIKILTERIRLVLRAPIDKLQQIVTSSWSATTCFPVPSDVTAPSGPQRYKRAVVLQYAQSV